VVLVVDISGLKFKIMVLKQRFAEGRTNYIDIGSEWQYIQVNSGLFESRIEAHFQNKENAKGCIGLIEFKGNTEPIYKDFPQWIYSNDGKLFMTLTQ
jgi:hypothetical protein